MRPLYIFDLDGTLALIEHRRHFIENGRRDWTGFYAACVDDAPNVPVLVTLAALGLHADIWVFSGRSDEVRAQTETWLYKHSALPFGTMKTALVMRPAGNYTPDDELKLGWLRGMLTDDRDRLVAVFEDRDRMVKMWRSEGVACFQVAPGDF